MEPIFLAFGLGIIAFTATNIDDLFILVMFFSNTDTFFCRSS